MTRVFLTQTAMVDLTRGYIHVMQFAPEMVRLWLEYRQQQLASLAIKAYRCSLAHENQGFDNEIRELKFGRGKASARVLFTISHQCVTILHIQPMVMPIPFTEDITLPF